MRLQQRDIEVMQKINGFGFATIEQIKAFMQVGNTAAYVRVKKLVDHGYLQRQRILHGDARIHSLTEKGRMACSDVLPPCGEIRLGTFKHDLALVDLAIRLEQQNGGYFIPPRRIRHNEGLSGVGQIGHIPDGYLHVDEDKPIAIELELSIKSHIRLRSIIEGYGGDLSVKEVWYFTSQADVARAIEKVAKGYSFIKLFMQESC